MGEAPPLFGGKFRKNSVFDEKNQWMDGWMRTLVRGREPSLRYIHWPLLPPPSHYSRALGRVIPTNNQSTVINTEPVLFEPYSIGLLMVQLQLQLPVKESTINCSIQFVQ